MRSVLEKQIVRRTKRLIRVRKVVLRIYWLSAPLAGQLARLIPTLLQLPRTLLPLLLDTGRFLRLCLCPRAALAAENLFLRKQLALYQEHHVPPRRTTHATRLALVWLGHWFDWRQALAIVTPQAFTRGHRQGFRLFWCWKSRPAGHAFLSTSKH